MIVSVAVCKQQTDDLRPGVLEALGGLATDPSPVLHYHPVSLPDGDEFSRQPFLLLMVTMTVRTLVPDALKLPSGSGT